LRKRKKDTRIADGAIEADLCKLFSASLSRIVSFN
jgi:hypothetical protein